MALSRKYEENKAVFNYQDYLVLPTNGKRYQILGGELFVSPTPSTKHQRVVFNLSGLLYQYLRKTRRGEAFCAPLAVILSDINVLEPDLFYVSKQKTDLITKQGIKGPPDLVVEVLSTGTEKTDRNTKSKIYSSFGVPHYWIIDPEKETVEVYRLKGKTYSLAEKKRQGNFSSVLFPGLVFSLKELWR